MLKALQMLPDNHLSEISEGLRLARIEIDAAAHAVAAALVDAQKPAHKQTFFFERRDAPRRLKAAIERVSLLQKAQAILAQEAAGRAATAPCP